MRNTDRQWEEQYLRQTLRVVEDNLENYSRETERMQAEIKEMLDHYHDNDVELWTILNNTITLNEHMKRALSRNEKAKKKPYFGRIIFRDETLGTEESLYIGKGGISRDSTHQVVVDWRAPVANAYYENGLGKCAYTAPDGKELPIDLELKRTYEIDDGKLANYFDTEVVANDDLLMKYLSKNKQAVLGEIVATIQKEQNEIIRKSPYHNVIVQGVAGSGKTTVAMHRISYILYNYQERFRPEDFYIVGSNRILLNYITSVLPDLDVNGVRQMTMEQLFIRLLYEDWDEKKYRVRPVEGGNEAAGKKDACNVAAGQGKAHGKAESHGALPRGEAVKGTEEWFQELTGFIRRLEQESISQESVYLNPRQFVEGLRDGKNGVYDMTREDDVQLIELVSGDAVARYVSQNPHISIQSKINMLNERLLIKVRDEFTGKGIKYTEAERKAILKAYRGRYGSREWKKPIFDLYRDFLREQRGKGYEVRIPTDAFDVYDLAALAYIYKLVKETEVISEAHHIVIDEAQDFGMFAYRVLYACIKDCTYTVMGDVSQNIHFGYGLSDWEELRSLILTDPMDSFGVLRKSYRNTVEISDFATKILRHGDFFVYPVEPIIRHGKNVTVEALKPEDAESAAADAAESQASHHEGAVGLGEMGNKNSVENEYSAEDKHSMESKYSNEGAAGEREFSRRAADICRGWQEEGYDTIAVVCRDEKAAARAAGALSRRIEIMESDLEKADFGSGIMVLPVEYTKGLEFDAVLIWNPTREDYPVDSGHARLLYVAATRALHELHVLHSGNLTGLIADPLPDKADTGKALQDGEGLRGERDRRNEALPGRKVLQDLGNKYSNAEEHYMENKNSDENFRGNKTAQGKEDFPENKALQDISAPQNGQALRKKPVAAVRPPQKNASQSRTPAFSEPAAKKPITGGVPAADLYRASYRFGDMPPTERLRPAGHSKINLSVKWCLRREDGLYLSSQYGSLRISPVGSGIVRITFAKGGEIGAGRHPLIAVDRVYKDWKYRDNGKVIEVFTGELLLQADKATGAIVYMTPEKKLLLAERKQECRQMEDKYSMGNKAGGSHSRLFLDWQKGEQILALEYLSGPEGQPGLSLRGTARILSGQGAPGGMGGLPLILSDRGYGLIPAATGLCFSCDIPAYGSYLYMENKDSGEAKGSRAEENHFMDYYVIAGRQQRTILGAYAYLLGRL